MPGSVQRDGHRRVADPTPVKAPSSLPSGFKGNSSDQVAAAAYRIWQERGCPEGSADEIWFEAEKVVRGR